MSFLLKHLYNGGNFKSKAGYPATINTVNPQNKSEMFEGFVLISNYEYKVVWDEFGSPNNLPINKELNLIPLKEEIKKIYSPIPQNERT